MELPIEQVAQQYLYQLFYKRNGNILSSQKTWLDTHMSIK
jgi:hypothetical protein